MAKGTDFFDDVHSEPTVNTEETGVIRLTPVEETTGYEESATALGPYTGNPDSRGNVADTPQLIAKFYDIKKVVVKDGVLSLEFDEVVTYEGLEPVKHHMTRTGGLAPHGDLVNCLDRLIPFLAHATKQRPAKELPVRLAPGEHIEMALKKEFSVTTVAIGKTKGVTLGGWRKLWDKRGMNLLTNYIDFNDGVEPWYPFAEDVLRIVDELKQEAVLAMEGKCFNPQLSVFGQEPDEDAA